MTLQAPPGAEEPFNWHKFFIEMSVEPASRQFFSIVQEDMFSQCEVKIGMKLEAEDVKNQKNICVATVTNVMGDRFLVHFDSWDSIYDYWVDVTSPFIHPVGWAARNNQPLMAPARNNTKKMNLNFIFSR